MNESDRLSELGAVHHSYATILKSVLVSLHYFWGTLPNDPFSGVGDRTPEIVIQILAPATERLKEILRRQLATIENTLENRGVPQSCWDELVRIDQRLGSWDTSAPAKALKDLQDLAKATVHTLEAAAASRPAQKPGLGKEPSRDLERAAREIDRIICLYDLHMMLDFLQNKYEEARSIIAELRHRRHETANGSGGALLSRILHAACASFKETADFREIEIVQTNPFPDVRVAIPHDRLSEILIKLLDNAIKFTSPLPKNSRYTKLWIDIRVHLDPSQVRVEIENWGPPLTVDEYVHQLVFASGFRGRYAQLSGTHGTGMGLYHARELARINGGDVTLWTTPVRKRPANPRPTVTVVTLTVPLFGDVQTMSEANRWTNSQSSVTNES